MLCNIKVYSLYGIAEKLCLEQNLRTRNHTLTRINDAIRSLRSPLVCTAARMNAGEGGWHQ
jgi:hypothetical protein